jgi:putative ABC transport system substrate-binding protein
MDVPFDRRRRAFVRSLGGVAFSWSLAARAQPRQKVPVIGLMGSGTPATLGELPRAFVGRLAEIGWVEGRNVMIEYRWGEGRTERFAEIAAEFVRLNVDLIVTHNTPPTLAAKKATSTIPIIFATAGDPGGSGIVSSLSKPGGNVTGLSSQAPEIAGKRVELLRELMPNVRRLGVLIDTNNPYAERDVSEAQKAAGVLGIEMTIARVQKADDIEPALDRLRSQAQALYILAVPVLLTHRTRIIEMAFAAGLPTIHDVREYVDSGGLLSYGPNWVAMWSQAAVFADKILRGAKPGDLPVEQPTLFSLVLNAATAKALGLVIPNSILQRADELID